MEPMEPMELKEPEELVELKELTELCELTGVTELAGLGVPTDITVQAELNERTELGHFRDHCWTLFFTFESRRAPKMNLMWQFDMNGLRTRCSLFSRFGG